MAVSWEVGFSIVLGGIITILTAIIIENLRKPKLKMSLAPPVDKEYTEPRPAKKVRFLAISVMNKPLPWIARWMSRNPAIQCHGVISFHHLDGQNVFGRVMPIRWSYTPEPLPLIVSLEDKHFHIYDPSRFSLESKVDIQPGESGRLDVAARFDEEADCYGWNNENYLSDPPWRNTKWKLSASRYLIKITVFSSGEKTIGLFRLINDVPQQDFRIEEALPTDKVRD